MNFSLDRISDLKFEVKFYKTIKFQQQLIVMLCC